MESAASQPHPVLEELVSREPIFHRAGQAASREAFDTLADAQFWETGASGRRYSREQVWAVLQERNTSDPGMVLEDDWQASEFLVREIAPNTFLLTYTLRQGTRLTRRVTLWQRRANDWKILYHQGTVVADANGIPIARDGAISGPTDRFGYTNSQAGQEFPI